MKGPYEDILHLPHHVSRKRKPMSMQDRAAQFSPFAALTGYDATIREAQRTTEAWVPLDVDGIAMLNERLRKLAGSQADSPKVTIEYFVPDQRKQGGAYRTQEGRVKKVDTVKAEVLFEDGTAVNFSRIRRMDGEVFGDI